MPRASKRLGKAIRKMAVADIERFASALGETPHELELTLERLTCLSLNPILEPPFRPAATPPPKN
jgi:hypothetical protein